MSIFVINQISHCVLNALEEGSKGARHRAQLIFFFFVFLVEMGFHHVDQDGLDLLTS